MTNKTAVGAQCPACRKTIAREGMSQAATPEAGQYCWGHPEEQLPVVPADMEPMCFQCGINLLPAGSGLVCPQCGTMSQQLGKSA